MNLLPQLLRNSAERHPDRVALEDPERGDELAYREFSARANRVRDALVRHGLQPGDRVGIYAPKSVGTVVAIFGILDARAAYVPVDVGAPPQRNAGIFDDCSIRLGVVAVALVDGLREAWPGQALDVLEDLGDDLVLVRGVVSASTDTPDTGEASP